MTDELEPMVNLIARRADEARIPMVPTRVLRDTFSLAGRRWSFYFNPYPQALQLMRMIVTREATSLYLTGLWIGEGENQILHACRVSVFLSEGSLSFDLLRSVPTVEPAQVVKVELREQPPGELDAPRELN